ncbi:hypothetical protein AB0K60_25525 [Thermopolyspora sp. NPDC052614]
MRKHARDIRRSLSGPPDYDAFADNGRVMVGGTDVVLWPAPGKRTLTC